MEVRTQDVLFAVRRALVQREMLIMASSEPRSETKPDNRACWVRAIVHAIGREAHARVFERLRPLLQYYFSLETATNNCERGLGRHARHRAAHVGTKEGRHSWSAILFEIHDDGPAEESDVVSKGPHGNLCLTEFSRRLAQLWLSLHGRRFSNRRFASAVQDKGVAAGSMKAVHVGQRKALQTLGSGHGDSSETMFGVSREKIMSAAKAKSKDVGEGKRLLNFRRRTAAILKNKRTSSRVHPLAKAKTKAETKAKAKARPTLSAEPREVDEKVASMLPARHKEVIVIDDEGGTQPATVPSYRRVVPRKITQASQIVVSRITDLDKAYGDDLSWNLLYVWTAIIKQGLSVKERHCGDNVSKFKPAMNDTVHFAFSDRFVKRHPSLSTFICQCGNWKKLPPCTKDANAVQLNTLEDYRTFLLSKRKFDTGQHAGLTRDAIVSTA